MKRYIKSFTTEQLKAKLGDNYPKGGYLYIFKHGIGPGTIPDDVSVVRTKDLPNYYTAVWLDRFLTTDELRQYDIPDETKINMYLDRIGYCQKNGDVVPCNDIEACDKVTASTIPTSDIELLAKEALNCSTRDELSSVIGSLQSIDKKLYLHYMEMLRDDSLSVAYIAGQLSDELMCYYADDVEACDKVVASEICYRDRDNEDRVVALDVGMSDEDVEEMLAAHPSYYRSTLDRFDDIDATTVPKYFANMVSASNDPELDDDFLVEGYYDNQFRGLAESAETSDVSALNEYINDYANRGYFIKVHNLTDGVITEFSADNWFDDLAHDGGAGLFMSW